MSSDDFFGSEPFSWFILRNNYPRETFGNDVFQSPVDFPNNMDRSSNNAFDDIMTDMMQHLEDVFNNMGFMEFHPDRLDVPTLEPFPSAGGISLREQVLKPPEEVRPCTQSQQELNDNDDNSRSPSKKSQEPWNRGWMRWPNWWQGAGFKTPDLDYSLRHKVSADKHQSPGDSQPTRIIPGFPGFTHNHRPWSSSFFHSESISISRKVDGTVEERRTVRDSDGNVKTSVTTKLPDGTQIIGEQPPLKELNKSEVKNFPVLDSQIESVTPPTAAPLDYKAASIWKSLFGRPKS